MQDEVIASNDIIIIHNLSTYKKFFNNLRFFHHLLINDSLNVETIKRIAINLAKILTSSFAFSTSQDNVLLPLPKPTSKWIGEIEFILQ